VKNRKTTIPDDVYVEFVRSLFGRVNTVLAGAVIHWLAAFLAYLDSSKPSYLVLSFLLLAAGIWRWAGIRRVMLYETIDTRAQAEHWERYYILWGTLQILVLSTFCFVGIYFDSGYFAAVAALSVTVGSMPTVVGRNYGSARMVQIFSAASVLPIGAGFVMHGHLSYVILGLLIIPFYLILTGTASHVREVLFSAVVGHKEARKLAQRFDRALNTMPHGLVMLNPEGRVIVANREAANALKVSEPSRLLGRSLSALLLRGVAGGLLMPKDCRYIETQLTRALLDGRERRLQIRAADGRHFELSARAGDDELGVITFEEITARVEAEERIRHMARYDTLTGLPNRAWFHEVLGELMSGGDPNRQCAIVVFDLDDFKSVNDTLGHPIGDGLLCAVAERLGRFASEDVKVSRFGGDEFMLFFNDVTGEAELSDFLDHVFEELQGSVDVAGHALRLQMSAGAVLSRVKGTEVDSMIVKADLALYKAKEQGKNRWRLFETTMDAEFRNRQMLKVDLRSAVEARALRVVYQPIVSMKTMRIESCEALCRWDHPELGPISPGIFIPLAEEIGVIAEISSFVLEQACTECSRWPDHISVSVNLSAKDFLDRAVVDKVRDTLKATGLAPRRLEIEVTETALLDDKASTRSLLEELKAIGLRIALDDFGTGYSSLSYLHTLPLDKIKIDRSFLMDVTQSARSLELLKGVVNLSRGLGLQVTVEGVETFDQLKILSQTVQPDLVQGFLFGAALTASGIETISVHAWPFAAELKSGAQGSKGIGRFSTV
jgi:diguanylate cyclase (GGDEF)-like protein